MRLIQVLLSMLVAIGPTSTADSLPLLAGTSRIDITPPLEMGATLGGYGERMSKPAVGVHDRLFAKALALVQGDRQFVFVTADVVGLPPPIKAAVLSKLEGIAPEQVLFLASHTHAGLEMNQINSLNKYPIPQLGLFMPELADQIVVQLATVIRQASDDATHPVKVGVGSTMLSEGWTRNRREGETETNPNLTVVRVDTLEGDPFAVLVHWATHPTFMDAPDMMFSGGWPGHMQRTLEALVGSGVSVLYSNGAEGDQAPAARPDSGSSGWERAERYGRELAIVARGLWESIETKEPGALDYHLKTVDLPPRRWHPDFMKTGGAEYGLREDIMEAIVSDMVPAKTTIPVVRLGDWQMVGIPGEMACGLGKTIEERARGLDGAPPYTLIGGLANEWISYILSPEQYRAGGYESSVSFYGDQFGPVMVESAISSIQELNGKQ